MIDMAYYKGMCENCIYCSMPQGYCEIFDKPIATVKYHDGECVTTTG